MEAGSWQDRGLVTVRILYLMFARLAGWIALPARSPAPEDAELLVLGARGRRAGPPAPHAGA